MLGFILGLHIIQAKGRIPEKALRGLLEKIGV